MSRDSQLPRDRTLLRVTAFFAFLLLISAAADLYRGTGGAAWLTGAARASASSEEPTAEGAAGDGGHFVVRDVLLFDGTSFREDVDVLVRDGVVVEVGADLEVADDAVVVDGAGRTLMPGLIDAHTHSWGEALRSALSMGVTTVLDMFTEPGFAADKRAEQAAGRASGRADLFSAGVLVTAPGGHGTEYGVEIPTLERPEDADAFVAARVEEGSDFIKIVVDDGSLGRPFESLSLETVAAVIEAAHARGLLAVVHVSEQEDAVAVVQAGADGIVHVFYDSPATDETVALFAESGVFVVPTLAVLESVAGGSGGKDLLADERVAPYVGPVDRGNLETGFPGGASRADLLERAIESVARLHEAGVPILAGTDAPNPGAAHGFSLHRELELLQRAGLDTAEGLASATSLPADAFRLEGRGHVRAGSRADLLLIDGDPRADMTSTRAIATIWKQGVGLDRDAIREWVASASAGPATGDGTISDFDGGMLASNFGSGWQLSTDQMMGGSSSGALEVVSGGADGSAYALEVSGELAAGAAFPWSGPMYTPGAQPFAPVDLSAHDGISFWLNAEGPVAVMLFSAASGQTPVVQMVDGSGSWSLHELDFEQFSGVDPAGLQAILFSAVDPGAFTFRIDQVRLR